MKRLTREDLLRFYDRYISPRSNYRRKLSVHVNPSALAQVKDLKAVKSEDELAAMAGEELPSTVEEEVPVTVEVHQQPTNLTEQPVIVDSLTAVHPQTSEKISSEKQLDLPKVNLHRIKSLSSIFFLRPIGLIMFMYGKVNCHVIHWLTSTKKSIFQFSVNYKENSFFFHAFLFLFMKLTHSPDF